VGSRLGRERRNLPLLSGFPRQRGLEFKLIEFAAFARGPLFLDFYGYMKKKGLFILKILIVLLILLVIYHEFFVTEEYWSGVYYPKGNSSGNVIYSPRFQNKEECIGWAINEGGLRPEDASVPLGELWECNKNCNLSPDYATLLHATREFKQDLIDNNTGPTYMCDDGGFDGDDWLRGDF
jgi:hypothetical protein